MGWAAVRRPRGILLPQGAGPAGCTPHCRRRKVRSAPFPPAAKTAPAPLLLLSPPRGARRGPRIERSKRECAAPGGREKALRRVGLRQRRPPAAGGGWLALPCRSQGRKRTALGESLGPGRFRDTPASLSAAAHASAENQPARSDAERAKREAGQMRSCTPTTSAPSATGRQLGEPQKT